MNLYYICKNQEKENFLKESLNDSKYILDGVKAESLNKIDILLNNVLNAIKNSNTEFLILDFELFKDTISFIKKIRELEKKYDFKYILIIDELNEDTIEELKLNKFYNIVSSNSKDMLLDALEGRIDENYELSKSDEEKVEENFYIFNQEIVNIKIETVSKDIDYENFLVSCNIANYLDFIGTNAVYIQYHRFNHMKKHPINKLSQEENMIDGYLAEDYLETFFEKGIFDKVEDETYKLKNNNVIYKYYSVPYDFKSGFLLFDYGYIENSNSDKNVNDIHLIVCDNNFDNIDKLKEMTKGDKSHILIIDALKEQKEYIDNLNIPNLHYIKKINSIYSISNSEIYKNIFKDFIEVL
ncbi:hypothetical protein [Peptoanaerobacter stomatis]